MVIRMILAVVLLAGLLITATYTADTSEMEDVKWVLVYFRPVTAVMENHLLPDTRITALFNSENKEVTGSSGCNTYFANYEVDGRNLTIKGTIAVTEMWCGDEIGEQERIYLEAFKTANNYEVEGDDLTLNCENTVLNFKRE